MYWIPVLVHMLWFNFILGLNFIFLCFKLIIIHYHTTKTKENKFKPKVKITFLQFSNSVAMEMHCWIVIQSMQLNQLSLAFSSFLAQKRCSIIWHLLLKMKNEILKYYFLSNKWVKCRAEREKRHISAETTKTISLWKLQIGILLLTTLYPWSSNTPLLPPPHPTQPPDPSAKTPIRS